MQIHPEAFWMLLYYMGVGMLSIFIVMGLIIGVTVLLNVLTNGKKKL